MHAFSLLLETGYVAQADCEFQDSRGLSVSASQDYRYVSTLSLSNPIPSFSLERTHHVLKGTDIYFNFHTSNTGYQRKQ